MAVVERASEVVYLTAARRAPTGVAEHVGRRVGAVLPEWGLVMATYRGDPARPERWAEPVWIEVADTLDAQLASSWEALDPRYRVAIAGRYVNGDTTWRIVGAPSVRTA